MVNITPFQLEHLFAITDRDATVSDPRYQHVITAFPAITAWDENKVIGCGGIIQSMGHSGMLWSVLSKDTARHMVAITRATKRLMEASCLKRIEATVEEGFDPGCRWLEMLGFTLETPKPMRYFAADGKAHYLYGWVK